MQKYGQYWLRRHGYDLSLLQLVKVSLLSVGFLAFWIGFRFWLASVFRKLRLRADCIGMVLAAATLAFWMETPERLDADIAMLLFPRQMVFLVALAIPLAGFLFWRSRWCGRRLATLVVVFFAPLLSIRIMFGMI